MMKIQLTAAKVLTISNSPTAISQIGFKIARIFFPRLSPARLFRETKFLIPKAVIQIPAITKATSV